jgi:hypothetical protein
MVEILLLVILLHWVEEEVLLIKLDPSRGIRVVRVEERASMIIVFRALVVLVYNRLRRLLVLAVSVVLHVIVLEEEEVVLVQLAEVVALQVGSANLVLYLGH